MKKVRCTKCNELYECRLSDTFSLDCIVCRRIMNKQACKNDLDDVETITDGMCLNCVLTPFEGGQQ